MLIYKGQDTYKVIKQQGQRLVATSSPGRKDSRLFYIHDRKTGLKFLIDTGADYSVIPPSNLEKKKPSSFVLEAANKLPIITYGEKSLILDIGLRRSFPWIFTIADVRTAILGADFLDHYSFIVDVKHRRLIDSKTSLHATGMKASIISPSPTCSLSNETDGYHSLLKQFPGITKPNYKATAI